MRGRENLDIAVAYCHNGTVRAEFLDSLTACFQRYRFACRIGAYAGANVARALNRIVRTFLDETDASHLWIVDTDQTFGTDVPLRLLGAKKPIVGALINGLNQDGTTFPAFHVLKDGKIVRGANPKGCMEVAAVGNGCILIRRDVLEKMRVEYEEPWPWFREELHHDTVVGPDVAFCLRAKKIGIKTHLLADCRVGHVKSITV